MNYSVSKMTQMAQPFTISKHVLLNNFDHFRTDLQCYIISKIDDSTSQLNVLTQDNAEGDADIHAKIPAVPLTIP